MASTRRKISHPSERLPIDEPPKAVVLPLPVTQPTPTEREPKLPLERIGDILRRERERRGDDLQQIADYLCIRRSFLVAIENSRYDEFAADAYVIGFLRSYAEYMGLNGKETIDYYRHEMAGRRKKPVLAMPTPISEGRAPNAIILAGAAIAALLIYAVWYGISTSDRAAVTQPVSPTLTASDTITHNDSTTPPAAIVTEPTAAPAAIVQAPTTPAPTAATPAPALVQAPAQPATTPATGAAASASHVTITAEQASWVLVSDGKGHTIFDRVMKAGETYKVPDTKGLLLTTGNGAGVQLTLDGVNLPKLSNMQSRIMRNIPLDPTALKAMPTSQFE